MKAQINGELKDIYVKAVDTYPIGGTCEIPDDMPVPDGWELVEENNKNYIDISSNIVITEAISDLTVFYAKAKQSEGITLLKLILITQTGIQSQSGPIINIPSAYAPTTSFSSYCRTNNNYDWGEWNAANGGNDNIAFCRLESNGDLYVRTNIENQKVAVIDLVY